MIPWHKDLSAWEVTSFSNFSTAVSQDMGRVRKTLVVALLSHQPSSITKGQSDAAGHLIGKSSAVVGRGFDNDFS